MKAAMEATFVIVLTIAALLFNHRWVSAELARSLTAAGVAGAPANLGVALPPHVSFLLKLDHFAADYGYVILPTLWVVAFIVAKQWAKSPESAD